MAQKIDHWLKFAHKAFDLDALHFGMFTDDMPRTLDGLRRAQVEYTKALIAMIPKGVRTVLDVGCGIGGTTKALVAAGFAAEGLSPDDYHAEQFPITCGAGGVFHQSTFENFQPDKTYDLLLFSESPQYIDKDVLFPKCVELTTPGGHVLAADFFTTQTDNDYPASFAERDFLERGERAGFKVAAHRDITEEVIPNFEVMMKFVGYGQRLLGLAEDTARRRSPVLWKLARLMYGQKLAKVRTMLNEKLPARFEADRFRNTMRYAVYLLTR